MHKFGLLLVLLLCLEFVFSLDINREKLMRYFSSPLPDWINEQIEEDFKSFSRGITQQDLISTYQHFCNDGHFVKVTINKKGIEYAGEGVNNPIFKSDLKPALEQLARHIPLPRGTYFFSMHDGLNLTTDSSPECKAPILSFAKDKNANCVVLIPDYEALRGYNHYVRKKDFYPKKYPWDSKTPLIFWRGGCTGGYLSRGENHYLNRRYQAVYMFKDQPADFDLKFTSLYDSHHLKDELNRDGVFASFCSLEDHLKYKYLLDIDGNSSSYERPAFILFSNSLLFKQQTSNIQWYFKGLKPFLHYIPVASDFSDMKERLNWIRSHDKNARDAIKKANEFACHYLNDEAVGFYLYKVLEKYARLETIQNSLPKRFHRKVR